MDISKRTKVSLDAGSAPEAAEAEVSTVPLPDDLLGAVVRFLSCSILDLQTILQYVLFYAGT